jgi:prepilin-type N-terminal cleavage/methylation domain-containing protein
MTRSNRLFFRRRSRGFSLIETLVVLAIISVLMAMLTTALVKAVRMAKSTAAGEEMRQENLGKAAAQIHEGKDRPRTPEKTVQEARAEFRRVIGGGMQRITSTVLFVVRNDDEFQAYWETLLNPWNPNLPQFTPDGHLIAVTPSGTRYELPPVGGDVDGGAYPVTWEFISTDLSETGRGDMGGNVIYSDGRREYVPYRFSFPMTRSVAVWSHEFVEATS